MAFSGEKRNRYLHTRDYGSADVVLADNIWNQGTNAAVVDSGDEERESSAEQLEICRAIDSTFLCLLMSVVLWRIGDIVVRPPGHRTELHGLIGFDLCLRRGHAGLSRGSEDKNMHSPASTMATGRDASFMLLKLRMVEHRVNCSAPSSLRRIIVSDPGRVNVQVMDLGGPQPRVRAPRIGGRVRVAGVEAETRLSE